MKPQESFANNNKPLQQANSYSNNIRLRIRKNGYIRMVNLKYFKVNSG